MSKNNYLIFSFIILSITISTLLSLSKPITQIVFAIICITFIISLIFLKSKKFEMFMVFSFLFFVPFEKDFVLYTTKDFHSVTQPFFQFNILYVFIIYFFLRILRNLNRIKFDVDLKIVFTFNILCFISAFWAINPSASFYDSLRYLYITIIYIYFSRYVEFKQFIKCFSYSTLLVLFIQLLLGIIQIVNNGPIGLSVFGESSRVFREATTGYEKGTSGTFGHPAAYAFYTVMILSWALYLNINKKIKLTIFITATGIILLAAGRTSIFLLILICIIIILDKKSFKLIDLVKYSFVLLICTLFLAILQNNLMNSILNIINRFTESDLQHQVGSRLLHLEIAIYYIEQKVLFGWGINNYLDITFNQFPISFHEDFFLNNPIHNLYLLYAVEIGIVGLIIFLILIMKNFIYFYKVKKSKLINNHYYQYSKGLVLSIVLYSIYNFQGWAGVKTRMLILFWIASALIYNIKEYTNNRKL